MACSWELQAEFALQSLNPASPREVSLVIQSSTHAEKVFIFWTPDHLIYLFDANILMWLSKELHIMPAKNDLSDFGR